MHVIGSEIKLAARHELERKHEVETQSTQGFRTILAEQAELQKADEAAPRERMSRLLEQLVEAILAAVQGRKCRSLKPESLPPTSTSSTPRPVRELQWSSSGRERNEESEQLKVCGSGTVRTADGRCIAFDMSVKLARHEVTERDWQQSGSVVLHDPLVLNFTGGSAELAKDSIDFDLDADGCAEKTPGLSSVCGYLVFDRNSNGRVDDGSELFGTSSGNGFADLSGYDADHNGWIDEADPAFAKLSIWRGGSKPDQQVSLADAGVGALYLGQVDSPFTVKSSDGSLLGQLRATGIWLSESGKVGALQQVDLAVTPVSRETGAEPQSQSQAAPRTPEESPWSGGSKRVET